MPRLLLVHHTPSPATHAMLEAVKAGATNEHIADVELVTGAALATGAADVLDAAGYLLGTPANIGYMSGALKHFFDVIYYPCLEQTRQRPYGVFVHGNEDTTGALRAIASITGALGWREVHEPVAVMGQPSQDDLDALWDLGATVAATVSPTLGV